MKLKNIFWVAAILLGLFITSCEKDDETGIRPTVTSTSPVNNASGVGLNAIISVTLDVAMNASTITTETFTLHNGIDPVSGTVNYAGSTASFTPSTSLAPNTIYTATITTGAKSGTGKSLLKNYIWSFTTGVAPDLTSPTITLTDPISNAIGISVSHHIKVAFSESIEPSTVTPITFNVKQGSTPVIGTTTSTSTIATFSPTNNLEPFKIYTVTITTGIMDRAGNAMATNYTFSFTTGDILDIALPMVYSTEPLNNATGVQLDVVVLLTFSEAMNPSSINNSTFTLMQGLNSVYGVVAYSGTTATFTPINPLAAGTSYTAAISTGATDKAGNALASNTTWTFITDASPAVTSFDPSNLAVGVLLNKEISATFSVAMDQTTINSSTFTVMDGTTPVLGVVNYSGTTATFIPNTDLLPSKTYSVKLSNSIKNLLGTPLVNNYEWSFTTVAAPSGLAIVELGTAGNYAILAKSGISTTGTTLITGNIGVSPIDHAGLTGFSEINDATNIFSTSGYVVGNLYASDYTAPTPSNLVTAVDNMVTAYNDAAGRPTPNFIELGTGNIGGQTLAPGLYKWGGTVSLPTNVTISGSATDVWIFQIGGNLIMSSDVNVTLGGAAKASNIFWQVAGHVTFGTNSHFEGVVLSMTAITLQTGASMNGRALAQTAVVLDGSIVNQP